MFLFWSTRYNKATVFQDGSVWGSSSNWKTSRWGLLNINLISFCQEDMMDNLLSWSRRHTW